MKRNKFNMHIMTQNGELIAPKQEGIGYKMMNLLNGREYATDYQTDNLYKVQMEAMRDWIIKLRW